MDTEEQKSPIGNEEQNVHKERNTLIEIFLKILFAAITVGEIVVVCIGVNSSYHEYTENKSLMLREERDSLGLVGVISDTTQKLLSFENLVVLKTDSINKLIETIRLTNSKVSGNRTLTLEDSVNILKLHTSEKALGDLIQSNEEKAEEYSKQDSIQHLEKQHRAKSSASKKNFVDTLNYKFHKLCLECE